MIIFNAQKNINMKKEKVMEELKNFKEFKTEEEANAFQSKYYEKYCENVKALSREMKNNVGYRYEGNQSIMEYYFGNFFYEINKYLRDIFKGKTERNMRYDYMVDYINEKIIAVGKLQEDIIVYRAVDDNEIEEIVDIVKKYDNQYLYQQFLSTSLRKEYVYDSFPLRDNILKIYVPKGVYVLGANGINVRNEQEMLFPTGQRIKFLTKEEDKKNRKTIYNFVMFTKNNE